MLHDDIQQLTNEVKAFKADMVSELKALSERLAKVERLTQSVTPTRQAKPGK